MLKYFTLLELNKWKDYREEEEPEEIFPLVFENTIQLASNIWQTTITAQRLEKLDKYNVFVYNFLTQRHPKITSAGIQIDFDKKKAFEIKERILAGKQFPDHIKFNILYDLQHHPQIYYDEKKQMLTIGKDSVVSTFDGHHRKVANSLAVAEAREKRCIITSMSI